MKTRFLNNTLLLDSITPFRVLLFGLAASCFLDPQHLAIADESEYPRQKEEIASAWERCQRKLAKGFQIRWTESESARTMVHGKFYALHDTYQDDAFILGANDRYEFWLTGKNDVHLIKALRRYEIDKEASPNLISMIETGREYYPHLPFQIASPGIGGYEPLDHVIQLPEFKITGIEEDSLDGVFCRRIDWSIEDEQVWFPQKGSFWIELEFDCRLIKVEWDHHSDEPGLSATGQARFSDFCEFRGKQLPQMVEFEQQRDSNQRSDRYKMEFSDIIDRDVFFLSHYGLPEPVFPREPWKLWQISLLVGLGLVALGTMVMYIRKKSA